MVGLVQNLKAPRLQAAMDMWLADLEAAVQQQQRSSAVVGRKQAAGEQQRMQQQQHEQQQSGSEVAKEAAAAGISVESLVERAALEAVGPDVPPEATVLVQSMLDLAKRSVFSLERLQMELAQPGSRAPTLVICCCIIASIPSACIHTQPPTPTRTQKFPAPSTMQLFYRA